MKNFNFTLVSITHLNAFIMPENFKGLVRYLQGCAPKPVHCRGCVIRRPASRMLNQVLAVKCYLLLIISLKSHNQEIQQFPHNVNLSEYVFLSKVSCLKQYTAI